MAIHRTCDGVSRRDFIRAGVLGGTGLTLSGYLNLSAAGAVREAPAKAGIMIYLGGGPTHMDTFDLKPAASSEYRGEFNPINTSVPGIQISEHLPKLAKLAERFAILRGVSHTLAAHEFGTKYMGTGNRPLPSLEYPGIGSVVTKELAAPKDLPPYVAVPNSPHPAGYLGIANAAFNTTQQPRAGQPFSVRGIAMGGGLTMPDVERREKLLDDLDGKFRGHEKTSDLLRGLDRFGEQAFDILRSKRAREAFDIAKESPAVSASFGPTPFAQSCLLATRLVEAGVRFVTVNFGGWDTHQDNFKKLKEKNLPELDAGLAGLFGTLASKGLLESTAVYVTGEFGRTPKINKNAGRDHWPRAMFCLLAGGGIKGGQVLGASDANGMGPKEKGITPEDVAASLYRALGIDHHKEYHTDTGRPIMIVRDGNPIPQLFS
jgi:uncharacterized protein (DUF1501 family)